MQRTPRDVAATPGPSAPASPAASVSASVTPQIQLIPASAEGALDAAEEAVDLLLESGRAPGEVLVITTGEPHPWAAHELSFGEASYWAQHDTGDDVFYADATALARAAVRPVVVVAVNGGPGASAATALPLAHARAGALLIVCGDPQQINSVLGAGA
ncbi:nucleotide-binding universal stress UspA family protein [Streptomyces phaeoluteigriseus]